MAYENGTNPAELPPVYEETNVPELTLQHDADWMGLLILDPTINIDDALIETLNGQVRRSLGDIPADEIAHRADLVTSKFRRTNDQDRRIAQRDIQRRAGTDFRQSFDMLNPVSPLFAAQGQFSRLENFIAITRLLYKYTNTALPVVVEAGHRLYRSTPHTLEARVDLIQREGIDPATVLLGFPDLVRLSFKTNDDFLRRARAVGSRPSRSTEKRLSRAAILEQPVAVNTQPTPEPELSPEEAANFAAVAEAALIDVGTLRKVIPGISRLNYYDMRQLISLVEGAAAEVLELRPRDIKRMVDDILKDGDDDSATPPATAPETAFADTTVEKPEATDPYRRVRLLSQLALQQSALDTLRQYPDATKPQLQAIRKTIKSLRAEIAALPDDDSE